MNKADLAYAAGIIDGDILLGKNEVRGIKG